VRHLPKAVPTPIPKPTRMVASSAVALSFVAPPCLVWLRVLVVLMVPRLLMRRDVHRRAESSNAKRIQRFAPSVPILVLRCGVLLAKNAWPRCPEGRKIEMDARRVPPQRNASVASAIRHLNNKQTNKQTNNPPLVPVVLFVPTFLYYAFCLF
jgi:hypothetical protein